MPEFVKKTLAGYKPAGASTLSADVTHVLMPVSEYNDMMKKHRDELFKWECNLQKEQERHRDELSDLRRRLEKEYSQKATREWSKHRDELYNKDKVIEARDEEITHLKKKIQDLEQDVLTEKSQNTHFLRIARERGNQDRGITPKKEHHGYIFVSSSQTTERVQVSYARGSWEADRMTVSKSVWKTVLQTPYSILLPIDAIGGTIHDDLMWKVLGEMGVDTWTECENGVYPDDDSVCVMYKWIFRTSREGYWEVEVWTTGPVIIREPNLLRKQEGKRPDKSIKT